MLVPAIRATRIDALEAIRVE